ncbi:ABC-type dipeptide/oligopeptide transport system, ATPase component [Thermococcus kodakarensis KOD1]|uniref:ABC-type dipeptide/oligopeptide transport system, ATPase component n=1 Tax=Thermococcus kodakarensis (strain ATCC BAA-918 / JCM 12380 / KOD1) TaxID=69014 RepID=Q5JDU1_THEKO|nr:ABC transporter ATP-binding protein [Thermococcus kodakarensis]WCN27671.1 ABC transporter ATP-binding protein [Thermococcus kodakarensis]WCN29962.1 ABC transporter ATP-binding protein [Thermococcus kodakarensis]BAD85946.1 ABC-type dipeptide/oligopeptide transport system, ATPase component [Thermococcus kodakarensis KOD1]
MTAILDVRNLKVYYRTPMGFVKAVDGVSFDVRKGEVFGIAGESGCGKSTLVHSLILRKPPMIHMGGEAIFKGRDLMKLSKEEERKIKYTELSIIPQYAMNALNPTKKIKDIVWDLAREHGAEDREEVEKLLRERLRMVKLSDKVADMYPVELSGGMRQRATMVVSTLMNPDLLIADEITSALDVTTQRVVLELLHYFMKEGIVKSIIFVTHDLALLDKIADRVMVLYAGKVAEIGPTEEIIDSPAHPYTSLLIESLPKIGVHYKRAKLKGIPGTPISLLNPPKGCRFYPRCPYAMEVCQRVEPGVFSVGDDHIVACHLYGGEKNE